MTLSLIQFKTIRDNKDSIIKNFYYRDQIGFNHENQYNNFVKTLNNNLITSINNNIAESKKNNTKIFKQIVYFFSQSEYTNINSLICYTPKIQLNNINNNKRNNLINTYEEIWNKINSQATHFVRVLTSFTILNVNEVNTRTK